MPPRDVRCPRWLLAACAAGALSSGAATLAADVSNCLKLTVQSGAGAVLANACSDRLNVMYCVEGASAERGCADKPRDVTTLFPGATVLLRGYDGQAGAVHWAVCAYPEAPVGWDPGPGRAYACKKTCVMC